MDQFARIRQLRRDGLTIRRIADQLNHSPKTILKALADPEPDAILAEDAVRLETLGQVRADGARFLGQKASGASPAGDIR